MRTLVSVVALSLAGCVTEPTVCEITSDPAGASFQLGEFSGTTPSTVTLPASRHRLEFRCGLGAYQTAELSITPLDSRYPRGLHVVLAMPGEGISRIEVDRSVKAPTCKTPEGEGKNAPREDDGRFYWLK